MGLTFPTGHKQTRAGQRMRSVGTPTRARGCRCPVTLRHDETCLWCGRLPVAVIDRTWADRAREVERQQNPAPYFGREWSLEAHPGRRRKVKVVS